MIAGKGSGPLLLIATLLFWLPAATWAGDLPRRGTLGLELDPRMVGDYLLIADIEAGMETEVADAHAALRQLRARPDVDPERVAIFAQGEASFTAARLADANPAVAGVALWAPMVRPVLEWLLVSTRRQQEIGGVPEDRAGMFIDALGQSLGLILAGVEEEEVRTRVPAARPLWDRRGRFVARSPARWREMNDRAFLEAWPRVRGPILVMHGEFDVQNPPGESDILLRVLDEGKHPSHRAVALPGLDGDMGAATSEREALFRLAAGDRKAEGADRVARLLRAWLDSPEHIPDALSKASPTEKEKKEKGEVP